MGYSVLIVDDDTALRSLYRMVLEKAGYTVEEVTNGAEAMKALLSQTPDVLILDMLMPLLGGEAVIKRIRQMPALKDVKIVVVTAYPRFHETANFPQADRFLVKPIQAEDILETISSVLSE